MLLDSRFGQAGHPGDFDDCQVTSRAGIGSYFSAFGSLVQSLEAGLALEVHEGTMQGLSSQKLCGSGGECVLPSSCAELAPPF